MSNRLVKFIAIPIELYEDDRLSWTQKLMIVEIDSFSRNGKFCFVSNDHLAQHLMISKSAVEKNLKYISDLGYIDRQRRNINGVSRRILRVAPVYNYGGEPEKTTVDERKKEAILDTTTKSTTKPNTKAQPADYDECLDYFTELGMPDQAQPFMDWYDQTGWKLKGGNKIKDWKATARTWARRQRQQKNAQQQRGFNKENFDPNKLERFITQG